MKDTDDISIVIMLDIINVMDAYEKTDKSMSFTDFALFSDEAKDIEAQVAEKKAEILKKLDDKEIAYTITGTNYSTIITGFELVIKAADFKSTCQSLDKGCDVMVSESYKIAQTQLVENDVAVLDTGINDTTGVSYDGSGLVVAVLDTGLDYAHSAFDANRFTSNNLKLTYEQIEALVGSTVASKQYEGLTAGDVYISDKVPFGFDYADYDPDVYSTHNNHGTHVSGIIVGNDDTIRGVAPNAQLVSMKVFSDVYDSALSSWILSALEDCVILGVDVINMSLGTACGFSRESDEEKINGVYDKIRDAGICLMVAASNSYSSAYGSEANGNLGLTSNPDTATVGSPGTYQGAMSIASIDGTKTPYLLLGDTIIYFDEANDNAGKPQDFCASLLGSETTKEIEYVVIPGVGRSADYTGLDVTGKIALVRRGDTTFEEKAIIAQNKGAAGIIIYNNVSGEIKMNIGDATLAICSISQDDGKMLLEAAGEAGVGKLKVSQEQKSGPFISAFSSWGPTPDLGIKPEITGFGGNILSAVTGGGYDRLSGTSMATPNLSGVALLLRQHVIENFPEIANDSQAVTSMVYRLMMSTADIILNKNGLPYAVRKQGAGLANLHDSIASSAVITTYDENGKAMDKTKLELGDDPAKTGVYTMTFAVENFGKTALSYHLGAYVMTEGVSDTLTNAGQTVVTEQGYLLNGANVEYKVNGGALSGNGLTVEAGKTATVTVTITLSDADKAYLDTSFKNGMYVEGYITLTATAGTEVDMSVPYLAFYGDWTKAPMFDKDFYETNADELNNAIDEEDKNKADAYATRPIGGVSDDYVSYLGTYYFLQNPEDMVISANRDYIALSNQEGTIHSLRFVWAGMLRSAAKIVITITDDTTGEVIFETVDYDVRKSYGDGGSIYPANIEIEFDTMDYNLMNNSQYTVKLTGYMDYNDGALDTNEKNTFEFPLVVDFEAPVVEDVNFYYEYDKTLKKNRLYCDVAVYDNHYAMAMQLGYIINGTEGLEMKSFQQYMTPIYSTKNGTTVVTYELTDYIQELKYAYTDNNDNSAMVITCYDYALNYATYEIGLPDNFVDFYMDGLEEGLTLSPNEVYSVMPSVYPASEWGELLEITSSKQSVVRVVNDKLVAVGSGNAIIKIQDRTTKEYITFRVTVLKEGDEGYRRYDKPVADVFNLTGYYTTRAYYQVNSDERDIGVTGDQRFFDGNYSLSMYPSEAVSLLYKLDAFFPNDTTVAFKSSNDNIVTVDQNGTITAVGEGYASITMSVLLDGKSTYYSQTVSIAVKDPFVTSGPTLSHYFGNGGIVNIPKDLDLTTIGSFAFSNFDYVMKTPEELAIDSSSNSKQWFIGDNTITKVVITEGVETISA
ncbi:MAG: S8 family serine peptidase [Oscillospiraceae bacterium]|nr:S8 family serine peptidase [Oscillospiraceae bacterium]